MTDYKDIEKEYLKIEPLDNVRLEKLYLKYNDFFMHVDQNNHDTFNKTMKILIDIACSYSFVDRHKEAIAMFEKIKRWISKDTSADIAIEINQLYFCAGQSNFALHNYRKALSDFQAYRPNDTEKESIKLLIQICKDNLINSTLKIFAFIGLTILVVKYLTKFVLTDFQSNIIDNLGWFGALTLLAYGLFAKSTRMKNTA